MLQITNVYSCQFSSTIANIKRRASADLSRGHGAYLQQQEQFWLIWRPGTASGTKCFFLYSNSKVQLFQEIAAAAKFSGGGEMAFSEGSFPRKHAWLEKNTALITLLQSREQGLGYGRTLLGSN